MVPEDVYIAGTSALSRALQHVLASLLDKPDVLFVNSIEPVTIKEQMTCRLVPNRRGSGLFPGNATCIYDVSNENSSSIVKCIRLVNCLRNDDALRWEGILIAIVPNDSLKMSLMKADMFGGHPGGETAFVSDITEKAHIVLPASIQLHEVLQAMAAGNHLYSSTWSGLKEKSITQSTRILLEEAIKMQGNPKDEQKSSEKLKAIIRDFDRNSLIIKAHGNQEKLAALDHLWNNPSLSFGDFVEDVRLLLKTVEEV